MYDFAEEMYFDVCGVCNKSTRDRSLIRLLKSPRIMVSASAASSSHSKTIFSKTRFLSSEVANFLIS